MEQEQHRRKDGNTRGRSQLWALLHTHRGSPGREGSKSDQEGPPGSEEAFSWMKCISSVWVGQPDTRQGLKTLGYDQQTCGLTSEDQMVQGTSQ